MRLNRKLLSIFVLASALLGMAVVASTAVDAATFIVVNNDGPGEGFNDPAPRASVGGNSGTTLGAQRLIAFQRAADIWGGLISSAVTIRVGAAFDPLPCTATSAILGSAGPNTVHRNFVGAPVPNTWYSAALANALNGSDLDPSTDDISAQFNSSIGTPGCLASSGWYYGLDANPPSGNIDFVTVLLHELGHGLGFLTFVDSSGAKFLGFNDTYMRNLERHGATPSDYPSMTNAQRVAASTDTGNLHWVGANVRAASGVLTSGKVGDHVRIYAPNPEQEGSSVSHWDTVLTPNQLMEPSYTGTLHNPVLELPLLQDIGWTLQTSSVITVTPSSHDFGTVTVGSFADRNFTVQNTGGGTLTGTASTSAPFSIISGGSYNLGAGASQSVTVRFSPSSATTFAGNVTFTGGAGATRAVTGTGVAVAPPTISKSFGAATIPQNGTTSLSFTLTNPNGATALTGVGVSDSLPGGLVIATPNGLTGSCGGGTIAATAGAGTVSVSGATLAASASCTFAVNVTGTTAGVKNNTTGNVTSTEGGAGGTASASVTVAPAPSANTQAATSVTSSTGTLNGTVNPNGLATTAAFQWGTTASYGNTTASQSMGSGTADLSVAANLTGLAANTTYHYRVMATNSAGTSFGSDVVFTTSSPATATTNAATNVTSGTATLNGTVNPNGLATTAFFQWGATTSYGNTTASQSIGSGTSDLGVAANLTALTANTTYHYRVVASNSAGTTLGADAVFTTSRFPLEAILMLLLE